MAETDAMWLAERDTRAWRCPPPSGAAATFHATLPGYAPTPLVEVPALAAELGVGRVFVKDESLRLGLPAFKILGASWAVYRVLRARLGHDDSAAPDLDALRAACADRPQVALVTATDGNHGRALARVGAWLGQPAQVFVPAAVSSKAVAAIVAEGGAVTMVDGSYDDAVEAARAWGDAGPDRLLVQDMAWEGYDTVPAWIVEGYGTLFAEADRQLRAAGDPSASLVMVPTGVGSLLQAALAHYRAGTRPDRPAVASVEPDAAACVLASVRQGALASIATGETIMAGLTCGTPSSQAWPFIAGGLDAAIAIPDQAARQAMADLAAAGIPAGPCGAASLAGARSLLAGPDGASHRTRLAIGPDSTVLLVSTEGIASGAA